MVRKENRITHKTVGGHRIKHQLTLAVAVFVPLSLPHAAEARLGETAAQLIQRYGRPISQEQNPHWPDGVNAVFRSGNYLVEVTLVESNQGVYHGRQTLGRQFKLTVEACGKSEFLSLLKIQPLDIAPATGRRFVVPSGITLDRLHDVIQIVMGWADSHLHEFTIGKKRYTEYPESKKDGLVCGRYRIGDLIKYLHWPRDRYQNWGGVE